MSQAKTVRKQEDTQTHQAFTLWPSTVYFFHLVLEPLVDLLSGCHDYIHMF